MSVAEQALTDRITYDDLYRRWEQSNWSATELDFDADREGWAALSELQRRSAMWIYSLFFYGEDSVADNLSPYIDAAPKEEQKYFLATQQVDEARHAVFFHRFFKEVIGAGDTVAATLATTTEHHTWGYRKIFDRLDRMAEELRRDRSLPKFAQAITLYHLVVEATLAQPGQHFIEDYFVRDGSMPGFAGGMQNVSRDEQRHIGFGVKVLSELIRETDEVKAAIDELLAEVMRYTSSVLIPPGWDFDYFRCYDFEYEDIAEWGMLALEQKWRAIGYPMDEMTPGVVPMDFSIPPRERATQMLRLTRAGVVGEPKPAAEVDSSPEVQELFFKLIARSVDASAADGAPLTAQWRFTDAEPWHLVVANGSTRAERGLAAVPDVTLESSWHDFVEIGKGSLAPPRALLGRRLRVHGGPLKLWRFRRLFG